MLVMRSVFFIQTLSGRCVTDNLMVAFQRRQNVFQRNFLGGNNGGQGRRYLKQIIFVRQTADFLVGPARQSGSLGVENVWTANLHRDPPC